MENVQHYDNQETEGLRSMMGGVFLTCGVDNVGTAVAENGRKYPMHGKLRSTPAAKVCTDAYWEEDEYENQGFREVPFMLLYHFNVGYPLADEDSEVIISSTSTVLRGEGICGSL